MRSTRRAVTAGLCAAGILAGGFLSVAVATPASPATDCHVRFYFNHNTYMRKAPNGSGGSNQIGLAYTNDTFKDKGGSRNGYRYGTDGRAGGKTGWALAENISQQKVCN